MLASVAFKEIGDLVRGDLIEVVRHLALSLQKAQTTQRRMGRLRTGAEIERASLVR